MRTLLIICFFLTGILNVWSQNNTVSKKGAALLEKANNYWDKRELDKALEAYQKVLEVEPNLPVVHIRVGQIYELSKRESLVRDHFKKAVTSQPTGKEVLPALFWLGKDAFNRDKLDSSAIYYSNILESVDSLKNASNFRLAKKMLQSSVFAQKALKETAPIERKLVSKNVNFLPLQFFPVLTADNETIIFTGLESGKDENLYISNWQNGAWQQATSLSPNINTSMNEGTCSVSADGRTLVFTACNRVDGYGSCDLYISYKTAGKWTTPQNLGKSVNSKSWESQPSLSADGSKLYFASDRPGGLGKADIWRVQKDGKGGWSLPVNLGPLVNTPEDENAPFIHANNSTLIFASKGRVGMGGYDLYMVNMVGDNLGEVTNLGYPINNKDDQVGMFVTANGKQAYYTEDKTSKTGERSCLIYELDVPATISKMLTPTRYFKGRILEAESEKGLVANIRLYDLTTGEKVSEFTSDSNTGEFMVVINKDREYGLYIESNGYLFKSYGFVTKGTQEDLQQDILLEPIKKDRSEVLSNIFFDSGKFDLDARSRTELDKLQSFLVDNPTLKIEISGHTDDVGSDVYNLKLSEKRAESVVEYLKSNGISPDRIHFKGYGEKLPKLPNTSEHNREINRRIEWRIL